MPLVQIRGVAGVLSPDQKRELIARVTDAVVAVGGESLRPYVYVVLDEVKSGEWGIGGTPLTTEDVKALMKGP